MPPIKINIVVPYIINCLQFYQGIMKCDTRMIRCYVNKHSGGHYTDKQIRTLMEHHQSRPNTPWWKETIGGNVYWML